MDRGQIMSHIFISYSTRDSKYATLLAEKLRAEGFDIWIDNNRLRSSEDWWRSIVLAIDSCAAFVAILSPNSDQSKWVQREITLADQRNKPIFPLLLAGDINTPNWSLFVRTQYDDVRDGLLPGSEFLSKLAENVPRQPDHRGQNVVDAAPVTAKTDDPVLQAVIEDPPQHKQRTLTSRLVAVVAVIITLVIGLIVWVSSGRGPIASLSPQQHLIMGIEAGERNDYGVAIEQFTLALDAGYTPRAEPLTLRGDMHRYQENMAAALGDYELALEESPEFYGALIGQGWVYDDFEQYDRVFDSLNRALEVAPTADARVEALMELGRIYRKVGDYDASIEHYSQALGITRNSSKQSELLYELGSTLLIMRDFEAALVNLQQAADMEPEFRDVYIDIARAHEGLDDPAAALEAYDRYVELSEQQGESADEEVIQRIQQLERDLP